MIQNKELYQVDDYIKYFDQEVKKTMNYSDINENVIQDNDYSDKMIERIAESIGSSFVEKQKFVRQSRDLDKDLDQNLSDMEIFENSPSSYISCNSMFNGKFRIFNL